MVVGSSGLALLVGCQWGIPPGGIRPGYSLRPGVAVRNACGS